MGIFNRHEKVNPLVVLVLSSFLNAPSVMTSLPSHRDISPYLLFLYVGLGGFLKGCVKRTLLFIRCLFFVDFGCCEFCFSKMTLFHPVSETNHFSSGLFLSVYNFLIPLIIIIFDLGSTCSELKSGLLRVYSMRFCPYAQRTRLVLAAKQIQLDNIQVFATELKLT